MNSDILVREIILVQVLVQFGQNNFSSSSVLVQQIILVRVLVQLAKNNFSSSSSSSSNLVREIFLDYKFFFLFRFFNIL